MVKNRRKFCQTILIFTAGVFFILLLSGLVGCQRESKWPGLVINAEFSDRELTDYLLTRLRLKFITTSGFRAPEQAWKILAEAFHENRLVFREEFPVSPVSRLWLPARVYEAEKYLFIPSLFDRFSPEHFRGLIINFRVLAENNSGEKILLYQRNLKLKPCPPDVPDVLFFDGWKKNDHPKSRQGTGPGFSADQTGLWLEQKALCLIKNPRKPSWLLIRGEGVFPSGESQKLTVFLDDRLLDAPTLESGPFQRIYELSSEELGEGREVKLGLAVERTFPSGPDGSRFGVKIKTIYLRPK